MENWRKNYRKRYKYHNRKYIDIIYWENPQNLKSIPGVEHINIVIKV
jgi:hypothetical protein